MKKSRYVAGMCGMALTFALIFTGCPDDGGDIIRKSAASTDNDSGSGGPEDGGSGGGGGSGSNEPAVTGVTINPAGTSTARNGTLRFTAEVQGTNDPSTEIDWSVERKRSAYTVINADGVLQVGLDETAGTFTVKATARADRNYSDELEVTVSNASAPLVRGVSITGPTVMTTAQGGIRTFTAQVDALFLNDPYVTWNLVGGTQGTTITSNGPTAVLSVSPREAVETVLTLTAAASVSVSGEDRVESLPITITVEAAPSSGVVGIKTDLEESDLIFTPLNTPTSPYRGDFTITVRDAYRAYTWSVDGTRQTGTDSSFTVEVANLDAGRHWVTLIAEQDDVYYSVTAWFLVGR